jgi:hypothetical protein
VRAVLLSMVFEWGIALHDLYAEQEHQQPEEAKAELKRAMIRKMVRQAGKDYLFFRRSADVVFSGRSGRISSPTASATGGRTS